MSSCIWNIMNDTGGDDQNDCATGLINGKAVNCMQINGRWNKEFMNRDRCLVAVIPHELER